MNNLGVALDKQGRHAEAVDLFVATGRLDPASDIARRNTLAAANRFVRPPVAWSVLVLAVIVAARIIDHLWAYAVMVTLAVPGVVLSVRRGRRLPAPARQLLAEHRQRPSRLTAPAGCVVALLCVAVPLAVVSLVLAAPLVVAPTGNTTRPAAWGVAVGALAVLGGCVGVA